MKENLPPLGWTSKPIKEAKYLVQHIVPRAWHIAVAGRMEERDGRISQGRQKRREERGGRKEAR